MEERRGEPHHQKIAKVKVPSSKGKRMQQQEKEQGKSFVKKYIISMNY